MNRESHSLQGWECQDKAPSCFIRAIERGENIAHLFDQDYKRLVQTAKRLGVNIVLVERKGTDGQHIDLCGSPLRKAVAMCEKPAAPTMFDQVSSRSESEP